MTRDDVATADGAAPPASATELMTTRLRIAVVLTWALVVEHLYALVTPPYELGIEHAFHLSFGVAYAWLALRLPAGRRWQRNLLTILLGVQFVGRFFVFAAIPDPTTRIIITLGALTTLLLL
ncbi:hypothetical protein ABNF97_24640, partial [Plantactinospora sp. B6F1]|uniref:hypothetical protein n=1 Tax=Plantactinospora sp. B6F1 TaxID=3158971 RepID=UPI0032D98874